MIRNSDFELLFGSGLPRRILCSPRESIGPDLDSIREVLLLVLLVFVSSVEPCMNGSKVYIHVL